MKVGYEAIAPLVQMARECSGYREEFDVGSRRIHPEDRVLFRPGESNYLYKPVAPLS